MVMTQVKVRHDWNIRRGLLVAVLFSLLLVGTSFCVLKILNPTVVTFDCGSGRSIIITTDLFWEYLKPLHYEIRDEHTTLVDRTFFESFYPIPQLHLVQSEDGNIVGVYYEPGRSLVGFPDCEEGETWTRKVLRDHMILLCDFESRQAEGVVPSDGGSIDRLFGAIEQAHPEWRTDDPSSPMLQSIDSISVREGAVISDAQLKSLLNLQNLKHLHLYNSSINDANLQVIGELVGLQGLTLEATRITDEGLQHLGKLKNLKRISLFDTGVTNAGVKFLRVLLPACRISIEDDGAD